VVQISKRKLDKDVEERIWKIFLNTLSQVKTPIEVAELVDDLLTPTEKIVLYKRLAIALMSIKGYDNQMIQDILKVSSTTVAQVKRWIAQGGTGYKKAVEKILKQEGIEEFLDQTNETLYRLGYAKRLFSPQVLNAKALRKRKLRKLL